jgi:hypothetical protein
MRPVHAYYWLVAGLLLVGSIFLISSLIVEARGSFTLYLIALSVAACFTVFFGSSAIAFASAGSLARHYRLPLLIAGILLSLSGSITILGILAYYGAVPSVLDRFLSNLALCGRRYLPWIFTGIPGICAATIGYTLAKERFKNLLHAQFVSGYLVVAALCAAYFQWAMTLSPTLETGGAVRTIVTVRSWAGTSRTETISNPIIDASLLHMVAGGILGLFSLIILLSYRRLRSGKSFFFIKID